MFFKGKKILIIGGTGTIGKSILKVILNDEPDVIRVFSRDEYKQFELQNELKHQTNIRFLIGDIRHYQRVFSAMEDIDYVFHTAAMKHVTFCEYNPYEAVLTNIIGTYNVIRAAKAQKVSKVVFTSTDKAIAPTNNYGATKLAAEKLITSAEYSKGSVSTNFSCVRFGNVMGSRGSVIPLFINQIIQNKKITVTELEMTRFMMTLDQATNLTIDTLKMAQGGETFILKMPIIKLKDLAEVVIEEVSKKNNLESITIGIEEIGLRPGEKRYEELMTYDESLAALELPEVFIVPSPFSKNEFYSNAKKAIPGSYSSDDGVLLNKEDVRKMIISQKLI